MDPMTDEQVQPNAQDAQGERVNGQFAKGVHVVLDGVHHRITIVKNGGEIALSFTAEEAQSLLQTLHASEATQTITAWLGEEAEHRRMEAADEDQAQEMHEQHSWQSGVEGA